MTAPASYGRPKPGIIPALSIRAPWCTALATLGKRVENRTSWRSCAYRGPLILHASAWPPGDVASFNKRPSQGMLECYETVHTMVEMAKASGHPMPDKLTMRDVLELRSGAFAVSSILDVVRGPDQLDDALDRWAMPRSQRAWYMGGLALLLGDVRPFPLVPCSGALGLFGLHADAYAQVMKLRAA